MFSCLMASYIRWDDNDVRSVLAQHAKMELYSASSLKNSPWIDTSFSFRAKQCLLFLPNAECLAERTKLPLS
jgi:hypothetical protein